MKRWFINGEKYDIVLCEYAIRFLHKKKGTMSDIYNILSECLSQLEEDNEGGLYDNGKFVIAYSKYDRRIEIEMVCRKEDFHVIKLPE